MKLLDLFSGLRGWSAPWHERGHETFCIDFDDSFVADLHADINDVWAGELPWVPDVILASPPCERFSVMQIGRNWLHDHQPRNKDAWRAQRLVRATVDLIEDLNPAFFIVENPMGKLRKLRTGLERYERRTVTYCQYGLSYMKPTDLWGGFPASLVLEPACKPGAPCHEPAPRGNLTGVQGVRTSSKRGSAAERSKIPEALSLAVMKACERDMEYARGALF